MAERIWPSLTFNITTPHPHPNSHFQPTCAPRIMVILNAISKMLLRAFTYTSFVIWLSWISPSDLRQQVNAQQTMKGSKSADFEGNVLQKCSVKCILKQDNSRSCSVAIKIRAVILFYNSIEMCTHARTRTPNFYRLS